MPYTFYKVIHLIGIFMIMISLGGVTTYALNGGDKAGNVFRKGLGITHGIGLVLVLVAGFGLLARIGVSWPWPGWVYIKVIIWLIFGGLSAVAYRMGSKGQGLWYVMIVLGGLAAYLAVYKPF
ncbi:hypothetical protein [Candidatus Entotheonella palauensis]|uniref:Membrane protein n=1 Tax=Candidatus Entotheonella gemina TaxID=1429439 RepID=W4M1Y9_9BACT|nr:hypothetical protein [Candidatus Entotheonella palauensis]ETX04168.1 MAG: membrane protein [Candidatus Entotheonella gemina]